jgi:hypothetical protein
MDRADDEACTAAFDQGAQLAAPVAGFDPVSSVMSSTLRPAMPPCSLTSFTRGLGRLVMPVAPGCEAAGQLAVAAEHDRSAGLGVKITGEAEIRRTGRNATGQRVRQEAATIDLDAFI